MFMVVDWLDKQWYIHTVEYWMVIKKNEVGLFTTVEWSLGYITEWEKVKIEQCL